MSTAENLNKQINAALHYSYVPNCENSGLSNDIKNAVTEPNADFLEKNAVQQGYEALYTAITDGLSQSDSNKHVVPLSAGLDSRAILAFLLRHNQTNNEEIQTVTFGTPGTWDYEIGQQVASVAGVENHTIDLTSGAFDWSVSALKSYAEELSSPNRVFEGYVNSVVAKQFEDATFWSGFMGDPTAGAHQPTVPCEDWTAACEYFVSWNERTSRLRPSEYAPHSVLPEEPYLPHEILSYEEQLDFAHRQACFISPIVIPKPERYRTPFIHPEWLEFSLNLPTKYRSDRTLFKQIVVTKFPSLFKLPTDDTSGYPLSTSTIRQKANSAQHMLRQKIAGLLNKPYTVPWINYVDFDRRFRQPGQLRQTVDVLIQTFEKRDIGVAISPTNLWEQHQNGLDRSIELRVICSIELYLRAR